MIFILKNKVTIILLHSPDRAGILCEVRAKIKAKAGKSSRLPRR